MAFGTYKSKTFSGAGTLQYDSIIPAVAGEVLGIHALALRFSGSSSPVMNLTFLDNSGGTQLTAPMPILNNVGHFVLPFSEVPWFKTTAGNALFAQNVSGSYGGVIVYSEGNG